MGPYGIRVIVLWGPIGGGGWGRGGGGDTRAVFIDTIDRWPIFQLNNSKRSVEKIFGQRKLVG